MSAQAADVGRSSPVADVAAPASLRGCLACGQVQTAPALGPDHALACAVCHEEIERGRWRRLHTACALAIATLAMLVPASTLPLMRTTLLGASREETIGTCVGKLIADGWPEIALMVFLCAFALPLIRFALLATTLITVVLGGRPAWLGRAYRCTGELAAWAMTDVFLVGFLIAYLRLRATIAIDLGPGAVCLAAAGVLALLTRAATNPAEVWRAIEPDARLPGTPAPADRIACATCALVLPAADLGGRCPRCDARLRRREPYAVARALALTIAGVLLYIPANLYPIATLPIGISPVRYTVLQGVIDLVQAKLVALAAIVLVASFVIPMLKLGAMAWCVVSIFHRSDRRLARKTRAYAFVEEIGRWSMLDPFVIAAFAPVATYNGLVYGRAEAGLPFFTGVVVLTMVAVRRFDPRQMWDAARAGRGSSE